MQEYWLNVLDRTQCSLQPQVQVDIHAQNVKPLYQYYYLKLKRCKHKRYQNRGIYSEKKLSKVWKILTKDKHNTYTKVTRRLNYLATWKKKLAIVVKMQLLTFSSISIHRVHYKQRLVKFVITSCVNAPQIRNCSQVNAKDVSTHTRARAHTHTETELDR